MRVEQEHLVPAPKSSLQGRVEELVGQKIGVESFEERKIGSITFFLITAYGRYDFLEDLERKNEVQPSVYVVGMVNGSALFVKQEYTRWTAWDNSDGWNDPTETYFVKSAQRSAVWLMEPVEGRIPQIISYNHNYGHRPIRYSHDFENDVLAVGFQNLFDDAHYQVGLYNPDGTYLRHTYCGTESGERLHYSTVKPIPLHTPDWKIAHWLQTSTEEDTHKIRVEETLGDARIHELTFPRYIPNIPSWKDRLFDRDNRVALDPSLPWMSWFEELGVSLSTAYTICWFNSSPHI